MKLEDRTGIRNDHSEYINFRSHLIQFIQNHVEPMSHQLANGKSIDNKLIQLISVSTGYVTLLKEWV